MDNILVCESCGAKMRVRPATLKIVKELKCVKCRKTVIVPPEMKEAAKNGTLNTSATKSTAPAKPPVAKVMATPVAPATIAAPQKISFTPASLQPVSSPVPAAIPQPIVIQPVAPIQPAIPLQADVPPPVLPVVPPALPLADSGILEARIAKLETTVAALEARIGGLLKIEQQTAQKLVAELEAL